MENKKKILVTGATGFIGGWTVETLYLSGFANVRAGIRRWSTAARIGRFPIEIVLCDLMNKKQIIEAMTGASFVVHCAVGDRDIIVEGTENLLEIAHQTGIERFIHLSTADVYGNVSGKIDESFPLQNTGAEYGDAKIEAEKLCWHFYDKGLPIVVLRPSIVYGPFSDTWTVRFAERIQTGKWSIFKDYGEGNCNLVYVSDLIAAILLAIHNEKAVGKAFNVNGPKLITWNQYFQLYAEALNVNELNDQDSRQTRMKTIIIDAIQPTTSFLWNTFKKPILKIPFVSTVVTSIRDKAKILFYTTPSSEELTLYRKKAHFITSAAESVLGYTPKIDLKTGLQYSIDWLEHHDFLIDSHPKD
jgi:nucleoside-diphosphate-sugar epimerase